VPGTPRVNAGEDTFPGCFAKRGGKRLKAKGELGAKQRTRAPTV